MGDDEGGRGDWEGAMRMAIAKHGKSAALLHRLIAGGGGVAQ